MSGPAVYRNLALTGSFQSTFPFYRQRSSFDRLGGAPQPVGPQWPAALAMAAEQPYCPLRSLTKSTGKLADFLVRVFYPKKVEYSYKAKGDGKLMEKVKFSCILLGEDAGHYCEAIIKASAAEVAQALEKYLHGTTWKLSRVSLDGHHHQEFLHTSVRVVVDLKRIQVALVLAGTKEEASLALAPVPLGSLTPRAGGATQRYSRWTKTAGQRALALACLLRPRPLSGRCYSAFRHAWHRGAEDCNSL